MFAVRYINEDDGGELKSGLESFDEAKEVCRLAFANGDVDKSDTLQIWSDDDDKTAVAEFIASDFE